MIRASLVATALCFSLVGVAGAAQDSGPKSQTKATQKCEGLTGEALDKCKREATENKNAETKEKKGAPAQR